MTSKLVKKRCKICGMSLLSMYNDKDICFCHQPGMPVIKYSPVSISSAYRRPIIDPAVPQPGTEEYNRIAFIESVDAFINEEGKEEDICNLIPS